MKNTKKEELFFLGDLYSIVRDGDFSNVTDEEIEKLLKIINNIHNIGDNYKAEKIIKFFKKCQSAQKENCNQKESFFDDFYLHQESWKNLILQEMANKFSISQEERVKFCHYMKDYLEDVILKKKDINKVIENKEYLSYTPYVKTNNWHYIWLWIKEIVTLIIVFCIYNALVEPFEIIVISILFLIYLNIQHNYLVNGWIKLIEEGLMCDNIKKFKILLNNIPNRKEIMEIKTVCDAQEIYVKGMSIKKMFENILYFVILYHLFIQIF